MASDKKDIDQVSGIETTGHEWDGIKELNNPAPRWWLWVWFVTILFAVGYWFFYPAWPTLSGHTAGREGWSEYSQLKEELAGAEAQHAVMEARIESSTLQQIKADDLLYEYARSAGQAAFKTNCIACHGSGAQGNKGYPNLTDDDWLWGGSLDDIYTTLRHGIRANDPETRQSQMPAWGKDGLLKSDEIEHVAEYVEKLHLGDKAEKTAAYVKGKEIYATNCAVCHGDQGEGGQSVGAPRLNDDIWLYGGDHPTVVETITNARAGMMPAWSGRLSEHTIKELTIYVHSLGGGQ